MANEAGSLPSPESEAGFPPVDPEVSLENRVRLQERERRKNANPPTNSDNKYICVHPNPFTKPQSCVDLIFDRKCEWNKHMDKHDRPFRCEHPDCSKLQGFTYPGGLARHEKEVHGKHGGPTAQLVCPFSNCKRSRGKKFTRKENLEEHIKRCHTLEGAEEGVESTNNEPEQSQDQTVDTLLSSTQEYLAPNEAQPETEPTNSPQPEPATSLPPTTNTSFGPENIDPAIAAAQDATGLAAAAVENSAPTSSRKRKAAASSFVFKVEDSQPKGRAKRRKGNAAEEVASSAPEPDTTNVFEELARLRAENATLKLELQSRDTRIAALENVMTGFEQPSAV